MGFTPLYSTAWAATMLTDELSVLLAESHLVFDEALFQEDVAAVVAR